MLRNISFELILYLCFKTLLAFVGICLFIISEWPPLPDGLLWFLLIKFKVTYRLIGLPSLGLTTYKN